MKNMPIGRLFGVEFIVQMYFRSLKVPKMKRSRDSIRFFAQKFFLTPFHRWDIYMSKCGPIWNHTGPERVKFLSQTPIWSSFPFLKAIVSQRTPSRSIGSGKNPQQRAWRNSTKMHDQLELIVLFAKSAHKFDTSKFGNLCWEFAELFDWYLGFFVHTIHG